MVERKEMLRAMDLVKKSMVDIRNKTPKKHFDLEKPGEVEINKFYWQGEEVDRAMIVLRANGCDYYAEGGCTMCGHYDGTAMASGDVVTTKQYQKQWDYVLENFDINKYPIVCVYNLGDFLSEREISPEARKHIFNSFNHLPNVQKVIIESRAENVKLDSLLPIRNSWDGQIEVGVGLESSNDLIRNIAHRKSVNLHTYEKAMKILNDNCFNSLSYVNQKPPFLTEKEAIDDVVSTALWAYNNGSKAISLEPTAIQPNTLTEELVRFGIYRVPWLYSVVDAVKQITNKKSDVDLRIGGYFPEEVLHGSGSGGVFPFPTLTATNCPSCDKEYIHAFAEFNKTYDASVFDKLPKCDTCYTTWEKSIGVKDSRSLTQRVIDTIGVSHE